MADFSFLANGVQPVQMPDPVAQAQKMWSLAALVNQNSLAQYNLAKAQRADAAAQGVGQALGGLDIMDDNAVRQAIAGASPDARQGILTAVLAARKEAAAAGKDQADTGYKQAQTRDIGMKAAAGIAYTLAQKAQAGQLSPQDIATANAYSSKMQLGVDFTPPPGVDPAAHFASIASGAFSPEQQATTALQAATRAETNRHNTATEEQARNALAQTTRYQTGELGIQAQNAASNAQRARAATVQADPFGLSGLNVPGAAPAGAPPAAGTMGAVVPPDVQAQRDAAAYDLLQQEKAKAANIEEASALDKEIATRFPNGRPMPGAPGQAGPAAGAPGVQSAMQQGLHGDDFLQTLPPGVGSMVKNIAEGKQPPPSGAALRSPQVQQLMMLANQYDPSFDGVNWAMRYRTAQDFAPQGKSGQNITALNTAIGHLAGLKDAMDSLNNFGGVGTMLNAPINAVESMTGDPRQANVAMHANAVAGELAKVFRSTGMSEADIQSWKNALGMNMSPAQQQQVVSSAIDLMNSRLQAIGDAYSRGMGKASDGMELLSPQARALYLKLSGQQAPAEAPAPGADAKAAPAAPQSKEELLMQARDAISKGAPRDKVVARLRQMGVQDNP